MAKIGLEPSPQRTEAPGRDRPFRVEPITGALGAELLGIDISQALDGDTIGALREALLAHGVIFFRDQTLDIAQHKAFASRFGEIFLHPNIAGSKADPAFIDIVREPGDTKIIGEDWHSDTRRRFPSRRWARFSTRSIRRRTGATRCSRTSISRTTRGRRD